MKTHRALLVFFLMQANSSVANGLPPACEKIYSIAASAVAQRAQGTPESAMRGALPPAPDADSAKDGPQSELLADMHEILDEVYGGEPLPGSLYATYRAELCIHEDNGATSRKPFESVRSDLIKCASLPEEEQIECAMMLAVPTSDS